MDMVVHELLVGINGHKTRIDGSFEKEADRFLTEHELPITHWLTDWLSEWAGVISQWVQLQLYCQSPAGERGSGEVIREYHFIISNATSLLFLHTRKILLQWLSSRQQSPKSSILSIYLSIYLSSAHPFIHQPVHPSPIRSSANLSPSNHQLIYPPTLSSAILSLSNHQLSSSIHQLTHHPFIIHPSIHPSIPSITPMSLHLSIHHLSIHPSSTY